VPSPLKLQRVLLGCSQAALAAKLGLSQTVVSRIETGCAIDTPANREALAAIARFLGIPPAAITLLKRPADLSSTDGAEHVAGE